MEKKFIPALRFKWLTPFFDSLMKLTGLEKKINQFFLQSAEIKGGETILDFGCGTGTFLLILKKENPTARVFGLDIDPQIIKFAQKKIQCSNLEINLQTYAGKEFPYPSQTFDLVFSSLVFHHLHKKQKILALQEIYRILKKGGYFHLLDFDQAGQLFLQLLFLPIRFIDGFPNTRDHAKGNLPQLIQATGFKQLREKKQLLTPLGKLSFYQAAKN